MVVYPDFLYGLFASKTVYYKHITLVRFSPMVFNIIKAIYFLK